MLLQANDGARVIIDAGIGPRVLTERLRLLGADLFPRRVDAIVLTHHHGDHFSHAEPLARALRAPLFFHAGISAQRVRKKWEVREYDTKTPFVAGGFEVRAMPIPHDAPQVALSFTSSDDVRFAVATDLGHVPASLASFLGGCDAALLEANYCPLMLEDGPYPPRLKQRIRGGFGHLANEQTAEIAARLVGTRIGALYLGHLSRANNSPARALEVVRARCAGWRCTSWRTGCRGSSTWCAAAGRTRAVSSCRSPSHEARAPPALRTRAGGLLAGGDRPGGRHVPPAGAGDCAGAGGAAGGGAGDPGGRRGLLPPSRCGAPREPRPDALLGAPVEHALLAPLLSAGPFRGAAGGSVVRPLRCRRSASPRRTSWPGRGRTLSSMGSSSGSTTRCRSCASPRSPCRRSWGARRGRSSCSWRCWWPWWPRWRCRFAGQGSVPGKG